MRFIISALALSLFSNTILVADDLITTLRTAPLEQSQDAPRMMPQSNTDLRKIRNYPEQPPVIPHKIEGYQVDRRSNQCLSCHSRRNIADSQAPMVSITHFMDKDGQFLASVSPRRYFCNQCHVPQLEVQPMVKNEFLDVELLIKNPDKAK